MIKNFSSWIESYIMSLNFDLFVRNKAPVKSESLLLSICILAYYNPLETLNKSFRRHVQSLTTQSCLNTVKHHRVSKLSLFVV